MSDAFIFRCLIPATRNKGLREDGQWSGMERAQRGSSFVSFQQCRRLSWGRGRGGWVGYLKEKLEGAANLTC